MNAQEFAALKVGDKITNPMSQQRSVGTITDVTPSGVRLRWGDDPGTSQFFYSVISSAWTHWERLEDDEGEESKEGV